MAEDIESKGESRGDEPSQLPESTEDVPEVAPVTMDELLEDVEERQRIFEELDELGQEFPERWKDLDYRNVVITLVQVGIGVNHRYWNIVRCLSLEKSKDKKYIETLFQLHDSGIVVGGFMVHKLTLEKVNDKEYVSVLLRLHKGGVKVDGNLIPDLTLEKANAAGYVSALLKLEEGGLEVDWSFVIELTLEKGTSEDFISVLSRLHEGGAKLDRYLISELTLEKANDKEYVSILLRLQDVGIKVNTFVIRHLTFEKTRDEGYINALLRLQDVGIKVNTFLIEALTLEKGRDEGYVNALLRLQEGGMKVDRSLIRDLTFKRGKNESYVGILIDKKYIKRADHYYLKTDLGLPLLYLRMSTFSEAKRRPDITELSLYIIDGEMREYVLPTVWRINRMHEESDRARQATISDLPLYTLYDIVVYGREELFTSSFRNVLFPVVMAQMEAEGMDAADLIAKSDPNYVDFRLVLSLFARYDRLEEFLDTIKDVDKKKNFLKRLIYNLDADENGVENGIAIAETFQYVRRGSGLSSEIEGYLQDAYDKADGESKLLYGIIASMHEHDARKNPEFFKSMSDKYPIQSTSSIEHSELVNSAGEIIQQVFFYDDRDGHSSYRHMMDEYAGKEGWVSEDHPEWVLLKKRVGKYTILKYVNKPGFDFDGPKAIQKVMEEKDLSAIQIVHRGHSYHVERTLRNIPPEARVVFLGSCGGFHNVRSVLERAEQAHIIATKGTGTMVVNDPLLLMMDDQMLRGRGVDWHNLWQEAERKISDSRFQNYVNPAQNTSVLFINAYEQYR